jgi:hypothetical protein
MLSLGCLTTGSFDHLVGGWLSLHINPILTQCAQIHDLALTLQSWYTNYSDKYNALSIHDCKCEKGYVMEKFGDGSSADYRCILVDPCASDPCGPHSFCIPDEDECEFGRRSSAEKGKGSRGHPTLAQTRNTQGGRRTEGHGHHSSLAKIHGGPGHAHHSSRAKIHGGPPSRMERRQARRGVHHAEAMKKHRSAAKQLRAGRRTAADAPKGYR